MKKKSEKSIKILAVATGFPYDIELVDKACHRLSRYNVTVMVPRNLMKPHWIFSNTDDRRWYFLKNALLQGDYDYIWAVRGGYGTIRLVPYLLSLEQQLKRVTPKIFLGLSDVTSLHLFLNNRLKWTSWHAPVLEALGRDTFLESSLERLVTLLRQGFKVEHRVSIQPFNRSAKKIGLLKASMMVGGNLSVMQSHVGTPIFKNLKNKFLFIEEVGERGYRIDRMLQHLRQAGYFHGCKAIFLGEFTGGNEPDGSNRVHEALQYFFERLEIPVYSGIRSGHGDGHDVVIFGKKCLVDRHVLRFNG
ncbi:MAG: LD-carboxypeptidase [Bdellovibrionaceae bacterium]|nr:LD-carboxypeptidase [Pseudobdellovibrionaceae bacterium]MDW8189620.1 LD-carboxypeptidase [Pseudobdellovibrionaceae bacterium]